MISKVLFALFVFAVLVAMIAGKPFKDNQVPRDLAADVFSDHKGILGNIGHSLFGGSSAYNKLRGYGK